MYLFIIISLSAIIIIGIICSNYIYTTDFFSNKYTDAYKTTTYKDTHYNKNNYINSFIHSPMVSQSNSINDFNHQFNDNPNITKNNSIIHNTLPGSE